MGGLLGGLGSPLRGGGAGEKGGEMNRDGRSCIARKEAKPSRDQDGEAADEI